MTQDERTMESRGIQFFGKVSASLSHEIKNVFAVIGESSGLMEDLLAMHRNKGAPLDPDRLQTIAERIRKHLARGDAIVKNMNRFAHSADEPIQVKDLEELTRLVVALAERHAMLRGVSLEVSSEDSPVPVETNPFLLQQLLWTCIDFAVSVCGPSRKVTLRVGQAENGGRVILDSLEIPTSSTEEILPREAGFLMRELGVGVSVCADGKEIGLFVPKRISNQWENRQMAEIIE